MVSNKRGLKREPGYSKVWIKELNIPAYLRDLNKIGLKIDIPMDMEVKTGEILSLVILPEEAIKIPSFEISVEVRWSRRDDPFTSLGVKINPIRDSIYKKNYEKLIAFYREKE